MNTRVPMPTDTPELAPPTIAPVLPEVSFHEIWGVDESGTIPPAQFWVRRHLTSFRSPSPLYTKKKDQIPVLWQVVGGAGVWRGLLRSEQARKISSWPFVPLPR